MNLRDLLLPGIKSILIKGAPGSGKTTAALELIRLAGGGVYVTTRVAKERLGDQYPWLKGLESRRKLLKVSLKPRMEIQDLRLGVAEDIIRQVLDGLHRLRRPLVVLDSWDAVAKEMDAVERLKAEKTIVAGVEGSDGRVIFISEEPAQTTTDYLVDAILRLHDSEYENRRLREAEWIKLRGKPINRKRVLLTLADGRFHLIPPLTILLPKARKEFKPTAHSENHFSTGSPDLDEFLKGGLLKGSFILLEAGRTVGADWHTPLVISIIANFLANKGGAVVLPSTGFTAQMVLDAMQTYVRPPLLEKNLRILTYEEAETRSPLLGLRDKPIHHWRSALWAATDELMREEDRPCFYFIGMDLVELMGGSAAAFTLLQQDIGRLRSRRNATILMVKSGSAITQTLSDICDLHLKLEEVDGSLILYSKRPPTILHAVAYDYSKGYPQVRLIQIV